MPSKKGFQNARILVTRTDRLGDVLLATPVLRKIQETYPEAHLTFLVQKQWMSVLRFQDQIQLMEYDPKTSEVDLVRQLKNQKFDVAIILRDEKKVSWAIKAARIPVRIGPYSTIRSFLTFNFGVLQKRSRCKMHESEYNLQLLKRLGVEFEGPAKSIKKLPRALIGIESSAAERVREFLIQHAIEPGSFVCLHPGSSGSARYLSFEKMSEFIKLLLLKLAEKKMKLILTGGPLEAELLAQYKKSYPSVNLFGGTPSVLVSDLAQVFSKSSGVIAHGTGPLHLAAAVEVPVFAIFPPLFVLSERRWGPLTDLRFTWTPPKVKCPEKYRCRGEKCLFFDCMDRFDAQQELDRFLDLISKKREV